MKSKRKAKKKSFASKKATWLGSVVLIKDALLELCFSDTEKVRPHKLNHIKSHKIRNYSLSLLASCFLIVSIWLIAAYNFSTYKVGNFTIYKHLGDSALISSLNTNLASFRLKIIYPDKTVKQYSLSQIGLNINKSATLKNYHKSAKQAAQILKWWHPINANIIFNKNKTQFNSFILKSTQITVKPAQNASIDLSKGTVNLISGVAGTEYGLSSSTDYVYNEASNLTNKPLKLKLIKLNPTVNSADLAETKNELTRVINQKITININNTVYSPTPSQIASWLVLNPSQTSKYSIAINASKVNSYLSSIAAIYNRPSKAQVNNTSDNQVMIAGQYGQNVNGQSTAATDINYQLLKASGFNCNLSVSSKPYTTITASDYPKWIEVDLSNKRLYAYQNSNLVQSYLVTAGAYRTPTVTGQYAIYSKVVKQNMRGENVDGSSYYQPNVPWINYFYRDYAIHGNYWRPQSYFGNVNSSHGCVGLIVNQAAWVYSWAPIGTPVIIHY